MFLSFLIYGIPITIANFIFIYKIEAERKDEKYCAIELIGTVVTIISLITILILLIGLIIGSIT